MDRSTMIEKIPNRGQLSQRLENYFKELVLKKKGSRRNTLGWKR